MSQGLVNRVRSSVYSVVQNYKLLHYILIFGLFYQQLLGGNGTLKWSSKTCF